jgi:DNA primase
MIADMRATIESIRERIDLRDLVGESIELRRAGGGRQVALCPFHPEGTASFSVWVDHAYCFGCHWSGDAFTFVMETRGVSFPVARAELAARAGIPLVAGAPPWRPGPKPQLDAAFACARLREARRRITLRRSTLTLHARTAGGVDDAIWTALAELAAEETALNAEESTRELPW